ncbi:hypothetical protein PHMEG_00028800 [Phytophthora megakarya]|uniref:Uncharacterized protein n=1 Tax=Phytophthora megakarya TaxID=4795 RepID=A0A225V518_9STRA|nr:hypothetical protein PHMEG_00028800 [Phytophthora megakarya]
MNAASALSSLYFSAPSPVSKPKENSTVTILPAPSIVAATSSSLLALSSCPFQAPESPRSPVNDGFNTPKIKDENQNQTLRQEIPSPSPMSSKGKRKRLDLDADLTSFLSSTPSKRKGSSDFLRKGQWTSTEERLARLLIEAFEEGSLPIYTGIRLRGYLAVQLQCDPMRVSKKLCAGTIDGKQVPKNYGQKKFKLHKKPLWDSAEAAARITELEKLTKALWSEARMRKPSYLTLSSTRNVSKERDSDDDSLSSPSSPARGRVPSSTPKSKKQKVFPIIYLNLSKLKRYSVNDDSDSDPASPESDSEPVRLDGESLQAAYDLLTLCSPRGSSKKKSKKSKIKKTAPNEISTKTVECKATVGYREDKSSVRISNEDFVIKVEPTLIPCMETSNEDKTTNEDLSTKDIVMEDTPMKRVSVKDSSSETSLESISLKTQSIQEICIKVEPMTSSV